MTNNIIKTKVTNNNVTKVTNNNVIKTKVSFIVLEEGEFLYDKKTLNVYTCIPPHKCVGKIDIKDFILVKSV